MAQCKLTPREFIINTFSPQVGAICSPAAESVCQKNNLSFVELLQPFSNLNSESHIKDPQGTTIPIRNLHLSIQDINSRPPEPSIVRKLLNDSVSIEQGDRSTNIKIQNNKIDIPVSVPWFDLWREMFLNVQFPSDHEFTKHFIACMIVIATSDDNPLDKIHQIAQQLSQTSSTKLPKWFNNNALRYYILIYDSSQDDKAKAEKIFTDMKNIYDTNNCYLLSMNSRNINLAHNSANLPDPWCQFLMKQADHILALSDTNSSPRTPVDTGCVSSMPNHVLSSDPDKTSQAGTPVVPQSPILLSPNNTDKISLTSELTDTSNINIEIGQEAVPVTIHPLSPVTDSFDKKFTLETQIQEKTFVNQINTNVCSDSPTNQVQIIHGALLSTQDLERIRSLITEFCIKSLLPYIERQISLLNDLISNKKGVSRSLFSATKRWFGTSKPGAPNSTPANAVIYSTDSSELQLRRLGDLCFMFGHYTLAYQAYHSAKRDFQADQAWLYYAGALEMAGLSAFMLGENDRKTIQYLDDAILTYSNTCKMAQFAVRATLLSSECLKGRGLYTEAAKQLIRMTSEDSDLRSALLLEQASYCFIFPKMIHKFAFHTILAGHRYSKAGQKKHSLRCYQQAYQVYQNKNWSLAEDHIHFTIGRQAASLKQIPEAVKSFEKLLNPLSKQPPAQQAAFLREFLQIQNLLTTESISGDIVGLPALSLPLVEDKNIKIYCGSIGDCSPFDCDDEDESKWWKLEEILITEAQGTPPMIFKPTVAVYSDKSNNTTEPIGIVDEPIYLSVEMFNPLGILLTLGKVKLIWTFEKNDDELLTNEIETENSLAESSCIVKSSIIDSILLEPNSRQRAILSVTPSMIGKLKILGISYNLSNIIGATSETGNPQGNFVVHGKKLFKIRGPKLKNVIEKSNEVLYGIDKRLEINIVDKSPFLDLSFTKISSEMLCGEIQELKVTIKNTGKSGLKNLLIASKNSNLFCFDKKYTNNSSVKSNYVTKININDCLQSDKSLDMSLWIRAPHKKCNHKLDLLFYYENIDKNNVLKYRLQRHSWMLTVLNSVHIKTIARQSMITNIDVPTLNLVLQIKNSNQVHDPFMNEILLTKVLLKSDNWIFGDKLGKLKTHKIQPQEICHLLLKINRRNIHDKITDEFTSISLVDNEIESIITPPYVDFVERIQTLSSKIGEDDYSKIALEGNRAGENLNMTFIVRWKARVMEGKVLVREAIGQHQLDLNILNQVYKHPEDALPEPSDYPTRLIIFGPDRNVPNTNEVKKKNIICNNEPKNIVTFSLEHDKNIVHGFGERRICVVPVTMNIQNHSKTRLQIKVNTIGTSSQTFLPSIKSQLYSPKASTFFRYVCHTAINCHIEPLGYHSIKLQAVVSSPGTFDFASRIEIAARANDIHKFIPQKWRIESVCAINDINY